MTHQPPPAYLSAASLVALAAGGAPRLFHRRRPRERGTQRQRKGPPRCRSRWRRPAGNGADPAAAIGNVEAYSTVAIKARVDGQIVDGEFPRRRSGQEGRGAVPHRSASYEAALRQAEANALRDTAARDQARSQEKRYQELLDKNFISKEAYAQIRTNAETAEATARASQAALENARLESRVLHHQLAARRLRRQGAAAGGQHGQGERRQPARRDQPGAADLRQFRGARAEPARGSQVPWRAGPLRSKYSGTTRSSCSRGRLIFVDNAVDPTHRHDPPARAIRNADAALWPGQFVNVSVRLYEQPNAIVVPAPAVQNGPEGQYVYVIGQECSPRCARSRCSAPTASAPIVASGLSARASSVVTRGQLRLGPRPACRSPSRREPPS